MRPLPAAEPSQERAKGHASALVQALSRCRRRIGSMVSSRGGKYGFVYASRQDVYRALRRKGYSKEKSARIANAGNSKAKRQNMGRKAARTRRRR